MLVGVVAVNALVKARLAQIEIAIIAGLAVEVGIRDVGITVIAADSECSGRVESGGKRLDLEFRLSLGLFNHWSGLRGGLRHRLAGHQGRVGVQLEIGGV
jgi:hypothetical protein